ncbi:Uncharacterized protein TCM_042651 [Theobroma cacao]|uniref:Uncharacterized protein n=1 Tax=Theobroma cacao TaxID=3641 RepID=A0A061FMQ0_THECC|nr:Uncharacterized protein TCM_042651 [Theobroma cacao]
MLRVGFSNAFEGMQILPPWELYASAVMVKEVNARAHGMPLILAQRFNAFHGNTSSDLMNNRIPWFSVLTFSLMLNIYIYRY